MELSDEQLLEMYEMLVLSRETEARLVDLYEHGKIPTFVHAGQGEEAVGVGSIYALRRDDYLVASHRPQVANFVLKGADFGKTLAEVMGKKTGYSEGRAGIMHMAMYDVGCIGALGMIGYNLPLATGAGLSIKMKGTDQVCLNIFGDGASGQGTFHESLNMASCWQLPVVYLCNNNQFAVTTRSCDIFKARIGDRGVAYAIPSVTVDGTDVLAVYEATTEAIARARRGEGPSLIEAVTYRWRAHAEGIDKLVADRPYRCQEEIDEHQRGKDPLILFGKKLESRGILTDDKKAEIASRVQQKIDEAVEFATKSPLPKPEEALRCVFGPC
jgi:TPP-dependent pyruvate/acetoin dehydrogenase alpha subunit